MGKSGLWPDTLSYSEKAYKSLIASLLHLVSREKRKVNEIDIAFHLLACHYSRELAAKPTCLAS